MKTVDFANSFLTFRIDTEKKPPQTVSHKPPFSLNNARIPLDCRCQITEKETGQVQSFFLGANCKTERVGVERDIWLEPNADFVPIFSEDRFLTLKTYAKVGMEVDFYPPRPGKQPDRQHGLIADTFDHVRIDAVECDSEPLPSARDIVEAVLANQILVARTEMENERYAAVVEYPVKTINANERHWVYQTDTGPVLFPDLTCEPDSLLTKLEMAFSAFNSPEWTEFLVRVPTKVTEDISVYHYSRSVRVETKNQILRIK